jgi:hypothetical protein
VRPYHHHHRHDGVCYKLLLLVLTAGPELAGKLAVDVPFLMQQAHILYERQLEELHVQMQRVNSSTSVLGQSKGTPLLKA